MDGKNKYAYIITQDICNKFIEVNFFVGCMVSRPNRLLQRSTTMSLINKIRYGFLNDYYKLNPGYQALARLSIIPRQIGTDLQPMKTLLLLKWNSSIVTRLYVTNGEKDFRSVLNGTRNW